MSRILIVEDDRSLATALSEGLQYEGHVTLLARDGAAGLRLAGQGGIDLVILDVMLPGVNGVDVCRRLRSRGSTIPIVMLTSKSQELDKVVGLKAGADDYITKPFSFMEFLARVEAVLRRTRRFSGADAHTYSVRRRDAGLQDARRVTKRGETR